MAEQPSGWNPRIAFDYHPKFHSEKLAEILSTGHTSGLKLKSNWKEKISLSLQTRSSCMDSNVIPIIQKPLPPHNQNKHFKSCLSELVLSYHLPFRVQLKSLVSVLVNHQEIINGCDKRKHNLSTFNRSSTDNHFRSLQLFEFMDIEVNRKSAGMTRKSSEESGVWWKEILRGHVAGLALESCLCYPQRVICRIS